MLSHGIEIDPTRDSNFTEDGLNLLKKFYSADKGETAQVALAEVAKTSYAGQQQHNPDQPLAWDKEKSKDHHDCIGRHLVDRGTFDTDGVRHSAKLAWRALAALQIELEEAQKEQE